MEQWRRKGRRVYGNGIEIRCQVATVDAVLVAGILNALEADRAELAAALENISLMTTDRSYTAAYDLACDVRTEAEAVLARIRPGVEAAK